MLNFKRILTDHWLAAKIITDWETN